jgi:hypothetical protein
MLEHFKQWNLHGFGLGSSTHLKTLLFHGVHLPKPCTFILVNISIIKKTHEFIVTHVWYTKGLFQGLTQNNNMKLWKKNKEFENSFTTFYIFERNGWIIDSIHLHLLNIPFHQLQDVHLFSFFFINNKLLILYHILLF